MRQTHVYVKCELTASKKLNYQLFHIICSCLGITSITSLVTQQLEQDKTRFWCEMVSQLSFNLVNDLIK